MQGWTPDFIPKLTGDAIDAENADQILTVANPSAMECSRNLAQQEGIFVGISAGATLAAALEVAATAPEGANILCMLPDTGERYLTTPLFEEVEAEMSAAEQELSASTPSCQFEPA
jgi:cysteine synthase A